MSLKSLIINVCDGMVESVPEMELPDGHVKISKLMLSQGVHLGFLIFGALVSIILFLAVQSLTEKILSDNYSRVSRTTSEVIAKEFADLEFSLGTVSTLLSLAGDADDQQITQRLDGISGAFDAFETVVWLHKRDGEWSVVLLYETLLQTSEVEYTDVLKQESLQKAVRVALRKPGQLNFVIGGFGNGQDSGVSSFALVQATSVEGDHEGVVIAISNLAHVFQAQNMNLDMIVSSVFIRDIATDAVLYEYESKAGFAAADYDDWQNFDLQIGGNTLEIKSLFFKQGDMFLLSVLPYFVLSVCLIITLTITFYLRSSHIQARMFFDVNERLTKNNEALQVEIKKRELLNQTALRADRENRAIIDSVSDIIFETDIDGKILFLNARWSKITGFEAEQSVGLELFKILHPQDQHDVRDEFSSLVYGKIKSFRKFTRIRTSDGTFRAAELSISMINQDDTKGRRVVGTFTDVEERRRAERALSEAERKYRNIVQNAAGGIFQITPEGLYLSANPAMADILGYESPEQILREVKSAYQDVYVNGSARQAFIRELEKNEIITNNETQIRRRDGTLIWVNENIHTVRDDTGNILYFEGSIEDISIRKQTSLALQEAKFHSDLANRAKSEFLANMSHELRTPLNSIIGFSEMIKNEVFGSIAQRAYWEYARDINDSGKSLLNIINEILDISKIEAGERHLNESQMRVERLASSCIDLMSTKIEEGGLTLVNNLEGMPELIGEELSVKQVIMNLLSNAVKFTPKGGRVSLSYEVDRDGRLHLSITDTGIGLDEPEIQKALSSFGQVDNDFARSGSGTGLGLTLVDALLKLHGAEFELVSQKGIGTTATAIFPSTRVVQKKKSMSAPVDSAKSSEV